MNNYSKFVITNQETGEVISDYYPKERKKFYNGPRKYWRTMELYDKALILLGSKTGNQLLIFIKSQVDTQSYRVVLNATHIAEDIGSSRVAIANNIKKLIDNGFLIKEGRGNYFVNPDMFWSQNLSADGWNVLRDDWKELKG